MDFANDALLKAVMPRLKSFIDPVVTKTRQAILEAVAGPAPAKFRDALAALYDFPEHEVAQIWQAAIDGAAEHLATLKPPTV